MHIEFIDIYLLRYVFFSYRTYKWFFSIAVEPLYPQICQKENVYTPIDNKESISPIDLARNLNSIACSLSVRREDPISMYHLIMEARHYILSLWNTGE